MKMAHHQSAMLIGTTELVRGFFSPQHSSDICVGALRLSLRNQRQRRLQSSVQTFSCILLPLRRRPRLRCSEGSCSRRCLSGVVFVSSGAYTSYARKLASSVCPVVLDSTFKLAFFACVQTCTCMPCVHGDAAKTRCFVLTDPCCFGRFYFAS